MSCGSKGMPCSEVMGAAENLHLGAASKPMVQESQLDPSCLDFGTLHSNKGTDQIGTVAEMVGAIQDLGSELHFEHAHFNDKGLQQEVAAVEASEHSAITVNELKNTDMRSFWDGYRDAGKGKEETDVQEPSVALEQPVLRCSDSTNQTIMFVADTDPRLGIKCTTDSGSENIAEDGAEAIADGAEDPVGEIADFAGKSGTTNGAVISGKTEVRESAARKRTITLECRGVNAEKTPAGNDVGHDAAGRLMGEEAAAREYADGDSLAAADSVAGEQPAGLPAAREGGKLTRMLEFPVVIDLLQP